MSTPVLETPRPTPTDESLGLDRAFLAQMARMPLLAALWVGAALVADRLWGAVWPEGLNAGPIVVLCFGMVLAAFIDGWALKVPNWITLPLILSGWALGGLHDLGAPVDAGTGGFGLALVGTFLGFVLLFPMLAIGGVGVGDVKMQMGFGAWTGAFFGTGATTAATGGAALHGMGVVFWAFCFGAIAGGAFGLVIILLRRKFGANAGIVREIFTDLQLFGTGHVSTASRRAHDRRSRWVKLPYGIPLCVGFIMYLLYMLASF
jgi:prepilin peptidase CpaA